MRNLLAGVILQATAKFIRSLPSWLSSRARRRGLPPCRQWAMVHPQQAGRTPEQVLTRTRPNCRPISMLGFCCLTSSRRVARLNARVSLTGKESPMHSRKSRRALDLDLRTNSLESAPTAGDSDYADCDCGHLCSHHRPNQNCSGPRCRAVQSMWPTSPLSTKPPVTLTKPLTVLQATGWTFTTR